MHGFHEQMKPFFIHFPLPMSASNQQPSIIFLCDQCTNRFSPMSLYCTNPCVVQILTIKHSMHHILHPLSMFYYLHTICAWAVTDSVVNGDIIRRTSAYSLFLTLRPHPVYLLLICVLTSFTCFVSWRKVFFSKKREKWFLLQVCGFIMLSKVCKT